MATTFDPYHTWLGIGPADLPVDNYRLLGIPKFEPDADVIASARDRQMAHLRTFQLGPRSGECQRLLNEVAAAAAVLLDARQKAAYDASLPVSFFSDTAKRTSPPRPSRPRQAGGLRSAATIFQVVAGGAAGIFVAVLVLNYFWGIDLLRRKESSRPVAAAVKQPAAAVQPVIVKPKAPAQEPPRMLFVPAALPMPKAPEPAKAPEPVKLLPPKVEPKPSPMESASDEDIFGPSQPAARPAVAPVAPPEPVKTTAVSARPEKPGDVLEIYNTHNWKYGDSGSKTCNIYLRLGNKVVWKKEAVSLAWAKNANPVTAVQLPALKYDILRVEITESSGVRAGLADVSILRNGKNIAAGRPAMASEPYDSRGQCTAQMTTDGAVDSGDGQGYWLLPGKTGWLEILVAGRRR